MKLAGVPIAYSFHSWNNFRNDSKQGWGSLKELRRKFISDIYCNQVYQGNLLLCNRNSGLSLPVEALLNREWKEAYWNIDQI